MADAAGDTTLISRSRSRFAAWRALSVLALGAAVAGSGLQAQDRPLSAIDWLSDSIAEPVNMAAPIQPRPAETPVAPTAAPVPVTVEPLDRPDPAGTGLIRAEAAGFPRDLWAANTGSEIAALLPRDPVGWLPATRDILVTLVTLEADPPLAEGKVLLLARIDLLLRLGDLPLAARLMEAAGLDDPDVFRRWFDTELLTNNGNRACARLRALPDVSPTYAARIFCLARGGDWPAAALTLETAEALGVVDEGEAHLLARFLDTEMFEGDDPLPLPDQPTPLTFAMYEAIGQSIPTAALPIAFAHADLRPVAGWKARLEAAERLARAGALPAETLFDIYAERRPAASGGVWERAAAAQALDAALDDADAPNLGPILARAWGAMREAGLEVPFAQVFAEGLLALPRQRAPQALVAEIGLLGPDPVAASERLDGTPRAAFLSALVRGQSTDDVADGLDRALSEVFAGDIGTGDAAKPTSGAEVLRHLTRVESGRGGNLAALYAGLAELRGSWLEDALSRIALQIALLDRRA